MRNSSKDLSVFDFKSDEAGDAGDKLTKYQFLKAFTSECIQHVRQPDMSDVPLNDLHEADSPERFTADINVISTEENSELDDVKACSTSYYKHTRTCNTDFSSRSLSQKELSASTILVTSVYDDEDSELQFSDVDLMSDEECSASLSEASTTSGNFPGSNGPLECPVLEFFHSDCEMMDNRKNTVAVSPDFVYYRGLLFLESQLSFCSDCVKIDCSDASRIDDNVNLVCDIADIISISSQWSRSVEAVLFKLWIRTNAGNDVERFIASIADAFWSEKEKKIKSLAERYRDIWGALPDSNNCTLDGDMVRTHVSFSKRYFSENMEPFDDVIYPKGDPDAVSISKRDIELLEPDTFINDTIIDFYIKYLQDKVQPDEKKRFHFFNSFFFRKLADLDKYPGSILEGKAAFQRVQKWTRKLNIFEKDYIFVPVNFNLHWSLLVICHPGEIIIFRDDEMKSSLKVPCILHMDSIKGSHNGLKNLIQSYLLEEWKGRHPEYPDDIIHRFSNLKFVSLELPQQENSSDCGLFLLHYVELFLEEAPDYINPTRITKLSNFLTADWFPPAEASFKRFHIRGLLDDLLRDSSQKPTPTCSYGDFPCPGDDVDPAVELLSAEDSTSKILNGSTLTPLAAQEDNFEHAESKESTACSMEENGDAKTDTANQHLDGVGKEDQSEQQIVVDSPTSQTCSTSYPSNSNPDSSEEQAKGPPIVPASNGTSESQMPVSVPDGCTVVPDSPIEKNTKNPHEMGDLEIHADDDHSLGYEEGCLLETTEKSLGEAADSSQEEACQDGVVEVIPLDSDFVQHKRHRTTMLGSASKRRKAMQQDIQRRVTRSSSKECSA